MIDCDTSAQNCITLLKARFLRWKWFDVTALLAQISTMRKRSEHLVRSASNELSPDSQVVVRLRMIHDQFCALEAMLRDGTMPDLNDARPVLTTADIERIASALASRLGPGGFNDDVRPPRSRRPS